MRICIIARKRLARNTRVIRQAKVLSDAGHEVTVVAWELPPKEMMEMVPGVRYLQIEVQGWPVRYFGAINKFRGACKRTYNQKKRAIKKHVNAIRKNRLVSVLLKVAVAPVVPVFASLGVASKIVLPAFRYLGLRTLVLVSLLIGAHRGQRRKVMHVQNLNDALRALLLPFSSYAKTVEFASEIQARLEGEKFDFCQAHDFFALLPAQRLARKTGAKLVYDALEAPDDLSGNALSAAPVWLKWMEYLQNRRIIRSADHVICVGPALAEWTAERYGLGVVPTVVRNCCLYRSPCKDDQIRRDLGLRKGECVGVVVGSIYQDQGAEQLIDAIGYLDSHIHIAFVGPVADKNYVEGLRRRIEEVGVGGRFHILPPQPQHKVIDYIAGADFGIIARQNTCLNNYLSLPNKVFELIMARLPIASSRLPNIRAIVDEFGIGLIFDETDPQDIAGTIHELLQKERYSEFKRRLERAAKECAWEKESLKYLAVFHDVTDRVSVAEVA